MLIYISIILQGIVCRRPKFHLEIEPIALIEIEKIKLTLNDFICHKIVVIVPKGRFRSLILNYWLRSLQRSYMQHRPQ